MKRMFLPGSLLSTLLALSLGLPACDGGDEDEVEDTGGKQDGADKPVGTYRSGSALADFSLLVLKTDKTFHAEPVAVCWQPPCPPLPEPIDGTYRFTKSGDRRYLRLVDASGAPVGRYLYRLDGGRLSLKEKSSVEWFSMEHGDAWCGEPADCDVQEIVTPLCLGSFSCEDHLCRWECGFEPVPCADAGGQCVPLNPEGCAGGVVGDAREYSCGPDGVLGLMCCLPHAQGCQPVCDRVGTGEEGWYDGCSGARICAAACAGARPRCDAVGSRSEGWYTDGEGCGISTGLIRWDDCAE